MTLIAKYFEVLSARMQCMLFCYQMLRAGAKMNFLIVQHTQLR